MSSERPEKPETRVAAGNLTIPRFKATAEGKASLTKASLTREEEAILAHLVHKSYEEQYAILQENIKKNVKEEAEENILIFQDDIYHNINFEDNQDAASIPKYAEFLLCIVFPTAEREDMLGDLEQRFFKILKERGQKSANFFYWSRTALDVGAFIANFVAKITGFGFVMTLLGWLKDRINWN